jgi:DNA-binding MarR family transcriptional regulator
VHLLTVYLCVSSVKVYFWGVASLVDRPDLAAMVNRLSRRLLVMEQPILAAQGVSMWGYIALTALEQMPSRTQAALARTINADKTRIIGVLDDLQERGLIRREPDPVDRRVRLLDLTPAGRRVHAQVRQAIRREEERLLAQLAIADREVFVRVLRALETEG